MLNWTWRLARGATVFGLFLPIYLALPACLASPEDAGIGETESYQTSGRCQPEGEEFYRERIRYQRERMLNAAYEAEREVQEAKRQCDLHWAEVSRDGMASCAYELLVTRCQQAWERWGIAAREHCERAYNGANGRRLVEARRSDIRGEACESALIDARSLRRCQGGELLERYTLFGPGFVRETGVTCTTEQAQEIFYRYRVSEYDLQHAGDPPPVPTRPWKW